MRKKIIANYALDFGGKPCLNSKHWHFGLMCVRKMLLNIRRLLCVFILLNATSAFAASDDAALMQLQQQWAVIKYQISDHAQQKEEITSLMHQAADLAKAHPNKAEPMIWQAIIEATKAGIDSNFGSLLLIQQARDLLLQADKINPKALHGLGAATLGSLYAQAPKPPLSFGNIDLAKEYLEKAIVLAPNSLDANLFYGSYLHQTGDDAKAREILTHALTAPVQNNNEVADQGRRAEIQKLLEDIGDQE